MRSGVVGLRRFAAARADGGYVVDVREPGEYLRAHVPGAVSIPMATVRERLGEMPSGVPVYVICGSGGRSAEVADLLARAGVAAYSVEGGTHGWVAAGFPVVSGPHRDIA